MLFAIHSNHKNKKEKLKEWSRLDPDLFCRELKLLLLFRCY